MKRKGTIILAMLLVFVIEVCLIYTLKDKMDTLLQFTKKENYALVLKALRLAHREDLIGYGRNCLINPPKSLSERTKNKPKQNKLSTNKGGAKNGKNTGRKSGFTKGKRRS